MVFIFFLFARMSSGNNNVPASATALLLINFLLFTVMMLDFYKCEWLSGFAFFQFHIFRIPKNDLFLKIAFIACQAGSGSTKAENSIFYDRFTSSDAIVKTKVMFQVFIISIGGFIDNVWFYRPFL